MHAILRRNRAKVYHGEASKSVVERMKDREGKEQQLS